MEKIWVIDGKDMDLTSLVPRILYRENRAIGTFLRDRSSNEALVVGPKGFGKTIILRVKRKQMEASGFLLIPENQMLDKPAATPQIFSTKDSELREDKQYWRNLWLISLMFVSLKVQKVILPDLGCLKLNDLYKKSRIISPCDLFDRLLSLERDDYLEAYEDLRSILTPEVRRLQSPIAIFIDNIDEYFEGEIAEGPLSVIKKNIKTSYWYAAQFGLASAAREINSLNNHVKVCASIRQEVFQSDLTRDALNSQLRGSAVHLEYSKQDLFAIFDLNIEGERQSNLVDRHADTPMARFLGARNLELYNYQINDYEPVAQFILRHSLWRPRDIIAFGKKLHALMPPARSAAAIRQTINQEASKIAVDYMNECRPHVSRLDEKVLYPLLSSNVLSREEIHAISRLYDSKLNAINATPEKDNHPFCDLYRLGLLGYVKESRETEGMTQHFQLPGETSLDRNGIIPEAETYLIHPILYDLIGRANKAFFKALNRSNIVGKDLVWHMEKDITFVLKGDVVKYSEVMNDADLAPQWPKRFTQIAGAACREITFHAIDGGDSITLFDRNWKNLVSAALRIQELLQESEFKRYVRFGGDAGILRHDLDDQGKICNLRGNALRVAARVEPVANSGEIMVTDRFVGHANGSVGPGTFEKLTSAMVPKARISGNQFDLAKNDLEEPIRFDLFRVTAQDAINE